MTIENPSPRDVPETTGTYPATLVIGTNENLVGKPITFRKPSGQIAVDEVGPGLSLTRLDEGNGLVNILEEDEYDSDTSPAGTEWNSDGWDNLDKVTEREYINFRAAVGNSTSNIVGSGRSKLVMHDIINDKYYKVQFHFFQRGGSGGDGANNNGSDMLGGFSYTRQEIFVPQVIDGGSEGSSDPASEVSEYVHLKRDAQGGIYNQLQETEWNPQISPAGVLWNVEGWNDIDNFETREYHPLFPVTGSLGNNITDLEYIMLDVAAKEYYKVKFIYWEQDGDGAWGYTREKLNKSGNPSAVVFGDGSRQKTASGFIPQNYQGGFNDYTLQLSDIGKHVYKDDGDGYRVEVPEDNQVNFPIGSAITIVSGNSSTFIRAVDSEDTEVWGAGYDQTSEWFYIPNNSMATLLKIGPNKWMLSGAGLAID
jgi:hypothetical protein